MDIKYIATDLYRTIVRGGSVQDFVNRRFKSDTLKVIDPKHVSHCITQNGIVLPISQCDDTLTQVFTDYDYSDLSPSDIILDIGANTGIFSLTVSKQVKHVYAVEPLYIEELKQNILNNDMKNITPLNYALSCRPNVEVEFGKKSGVAAGKTLSEIITICGGHVDFLKCDCEGGEWSINPEELRNIRRVEMEVHSYRGEKLFDYVEMLEKAGFAVKTDKVQDHKELLLIHAYRVEK